MRSASIGSCLHAMSPVMSCQGRVRRCVTMWEQVCSPGVFLRVRFKVSKAHTSPVCMCVYLHISVSLCVSVCVCLSLSFAYLSLSLYLCLSVSLCVSVFVCVCGLLPAAHYMRIRLQLSSTSLTPYLPACYHAPHHDDNVLETLSQPQLNAFFYKSCLGHGVSSWQ